MIDDGGVSQRWLDALCQKMTEYYSGDPKRILHFIEVHSIAKKIGVCEKLDDDTLFILEAAAYVHDIGIKPAEQKYGKANGKLQEQEGPTVAHQMLSELGLENYIIDRICFLVGHHHTYDKIDGLDYQILVEADFLVNIYEDNLSDSAIRKAFDKVFKTDSGKELFKIMYDINY
ncbi:HD domain-containing protein [Lachnobacterium bovis]|uniref:HD domain-containing protein n=1 Tax=Lachnobacterium bovis TaxID=140626 RepID=A0A1H9PVF1_9FIRM|nr:HD domain-containing protein [Lachnobacterium bovis]SER52204.1 HD domain-containing protein [Lachnobacterium bovis]